jgi:hypothetical protein
MVRFLDNFDNLLYRASTMCMPTKPNWILLHALNNLGQLVIIRTFCYLLRQIVAEGIIHYFHEVIDCVVKDDRVYFLIVFFDLFLQESTTTLILS